LEHSAARSVPRRRVAAKTAWIVRREADAPR
jgi:hypothetical protein